MSFDKIISVNGVLTPYGRSQIAKSAVRKDGREETPRTAGEQAADRPSQAAQREMLDRIAYLERQWTVKNTEFFSYSNARNLAYQQQLSRELDAIQTELAHLRPLAGGSGGTQYAVANDKVLAKTDRARGRNALDTVLHAPSVAKSEAVKPVTTTMTKTQAPLDGPEVVVEDDLGNLLRL